LEKITSVHERITLATPERQPFDVRDLEALDLKTNDLLGKIDRF
jgi:hypothetical protein